MCEASRDTYFHHVLNNLPTASQIAELTEYETWVQHELSESRYIPDPRQEADDLNWYNSLPL